MCIRFVKWACDRLTEDVDFGKRNHLSRWSSFWSWRLCKQAKLSHFGHRKANAPKRTHCLGRVLVQRHNWSVFFENEEEEVVTVNGDSYRAMLNEFLLTKIEEENIGNIWFQLDDATCHTAEATLYVLRPVFEDRIISSRAHQLLFGHLGTAIWHRWTITYEVP